MENVNYDNPAAPLDYFCQGCGCHGPKLWRESNTSAPDRFCAKCAAEREGRDISRMDEKGHRPSDSGHPTAKTDQIGNLVPAIPCDEGPCTYWNFGGAPDEACRWWCSLPNEV